jgi:hypothetical protein
MEVQRLIMPEPATSSLPAVVALLRAHARIERAVRQRAGLDPRPRPEGAAAADAPRGAPKVRLSRIDLAQRLHVSASTVTRMTAPLEKLGMVGRQSDPRDARLAYVVLTCGGQRLVRDAPAPPRALAEGLFRDRWAKAEIATSGRAARPAHRRPAGELA